MLAAEEWLRKVVNNAGYTLVESSTHSNLDEVDLLPSSS